MRYRGGQSEVKDLVVGVNSGDSNPEGGETTARDGNAGSEIVAVDVSDIKAIVTNFRGRSVGRKRELEVLVEFVSENNEIEGECSSGGVNVCEIDFVVDGRGEISIFFVIRVVTVAVVIEVIISLGEVFRVSEAGCFLVGQDGVIRIRDLRGIGEV